MKLAIISSLQGFPEEYDDDAVNTESICHALVSLLEGMYPSHEINLLDRADYPGMGDAYNQSWKDANAWGADLVCHVHQDAGAEGARGFSVLFCHDMKLAAEIYEALLSLRKDYGIPDRGMSPRCGVAVLGNAQQPAVLVEAGFYTSPEDEAIGPGPWASAIALGIEGYVGRTWGIWPAEDKEEEGMNLELIKDSGGNPIQDERGLFVFGVAARKSQTLMAYAVSKENIAARFYFVPVTGAVIIKDWSLGGWGNGGGNHGTYYALANFADIPNEFFLEVHVPTTALYGGVF